MPATALAPAVTVIVVDAEPVTVAGLKLAVTLAGRPDTENEVASVYPADAVTVSVNWVLPPTVSDRDVGLEASEKPGVMVSVEAVDCDTDPLVPTILMGYVPGAAEPDSVNVRVVSPLVVREVGLNAAVTPEGRPVTLYVTVELKPPVMVVVAVAVTVPPDAALSVEGVPLSVKPFTVSVMFLLWTMPPLVPAMVTR